MTTAPPRSGILDLTGGRGLVRLVLAVIVAAGLVADAYTHYDLAGRFDLNTTGTISEGVLFRVEASGAVVVAMLVLVFRNSLAAVFAALVGGGGALLLFIYRYVNVGKLGPIPNMYEPVWYPEKVVAVVGELVAMVFAAALLAVCVRVRAGGPVGVHTAAAPRHR